MHDNTIQNTKSHYLAGIDGLRAIAVLSVIFYHFDRKIVPGGYLGVDIFFVISGYLITSNIWKELNQGAFSFSNFYLRRVRRIIPAFSTMLACTLLFGLAILAPDDICRLFKSATWAIFSASNLYFWRYLDTSYFAASSAEEPLLHTWSLGVEEQFYFLWPALLFLFLRRKNSVIPLAAAICVLSFIFAEYTNVEHQKLAYYTLPTRAGELLIGGLIALSGTRWVVNLKKIRELIAALGFAVLSISFYYLNDSSPFPGVNAAIPCIGAGFIIVGSLQDSTIIRLLLTKRPIKYIGLISYSLYLWHWPVLAFGQYLFGTMTIERALYSSLLVLLLSMASYHFIEKPTRRIALTPKALFLRYYATPSVTMLILIVIVLAPNGVVSGLKEEPDYAAAYKRIDTQTAPAYEYDYNCQLAKFDPMILTRNKCIIGSEPSKNLNEPGLLLWGDSNAAHYIGVIGEVAKINHVAFRNVSHSACPPVFYGEYDAVGRKKSCRDFRNYIRTAIHTRAYNAIILGGEWDVYDILNKNFKKDFEKTIADIHALGIKFAILEQIPRVSSYEKSCELRAIRATFINCDARNYSTDRGSQGINKFIANITKKYEGTYLSIHSILCSNGICSAYIEGKPVYYNSSHLSMAGSWLVGKKLLSDKLLSNWSNFISEENAKPTNRHDLIEAMSKENTQNHMFKPELIPPILGGFTPDFPYHTRSKKNIESNKGPSGVVLEYWGYSHNDVATSLEKKFKSMGFSLSDIHNKGETTLMAFDREDRPTVKISISPGRNKKFYSPLAKGIVYIQW